jgi:hypothetical protein
MFGDPRIPWEVVSHYWALLDEMEERAFANDPEQSGSASTEDIHEDLESSDDPARNEDSLLENASD